VYSRVIDDSVLTLSASGWTFNRTFVLFDYETESLWYHLSGTNGLTCISGTYADRRLFEMQSAKLRWNEWKAENPHSKYMKYY
jgi:hypothetical protein